jgi:hypothetical protein
VVNDVGDAASTCIGSGRRESIAIESRSYFPLDPNEVTMILGTLPEPIAAKA